MNPDELTWTCHACGEERPDNMIVVAKILVKLRIGQTQMNLRYCFDRPACLRKVAAKLEQMAEVQQKLDIDANRLGPLLEPSNPFAVHYSTWDSEAKYFGLLCDADWRMDEREDVRLALGHKSFEVFKSRDGRCYTFDPEQVTCKTCIANMPIHAPGYDDKLLGNKA